MSANRLLQLVSAIIILILLTMVFPSSVIATAGPIEKHVLFLDPFTPDYPSYQLYEQGVKNTLAENSGYKFSYSYECLDLARYPNDEDYLQDVAQYFKAKYQNQQPDFIITNESLYSLLVKYEPSIFPNVPIIMDWNEDSQPLVNMPSNYIVMPRNIEIEENVKLILQTRPLTKTIYIIVGDSAAERNIVKRFVKVQKKFANQVEIVVLNKLPYTQMLERLRNAQDHSAVLFFRWVSDVDGNSFVPVQVLQTICREVKIPVYGTRIQFLGTGIIGGLIENAEDCGQHAGNAVMDILGGKKPPDNPIIRAPSRTYTFDWRQLQRWRIEEHSLPSGSKIQYREITVWEQYRVYIIGAIVLLVLQALLIFALLINRSRRKRAENELLQTNTSLQTMTESLMDFDKMKDEFLTNTSHELQTPLNGIINISETLVEGNYGNVNPKQKEELQVILAVSRRLSSLIRDIIDIEKIKRNDIQLNPVPTDIKSAIAMVVDVFRHLIQSEKIEIIINIPEGISPVLTDETRFWQVLFNLIGNAIKFTERGNVTVSAAEDDQFVKIIIEDTGLGIAKEKQEKLFNAFTQGDSEIPRQYGGSGLGLYISRQLMERMKGTIILEWSEPGQGTRFSVRLPKASGKPVNLDETLEMTQEVAAAVEKVENKLLQSFKVLAVDDEATNLRVLKSLLTGDGYKVLTASSGIEAIEIIKDHDDIDLVLMDVMMPKMSGYEACRKIREDYSLYDLPLLILTVRNTLEDITVGFEAGANDFVSKPFVAKELRARVATLLLMKKSVQEALKNEMAFLQAQIKPHFLYNALSTIMSYCYTDGARAGDLLANLSEYLQKSFNIDNTATTVSLENELELTKAYTEIEKARFGERLIVEYDVDDSLIEQRVLPLTIQPLVENSIRHGLMKRKTGGKVNITVNKKCDRIGITVEDNGIGIQDLGAVFQRKDSLKQKGGVGLSNIKRRLMKYYGTELHLTTNINEGTKVYFTIPNQGMR
ncbi:ABC transporter substrate binding protein [Desulfosporosinus sp. OT]|uniref:ABC transporter substrate binding protein n=1 Tax=Desulfosporosinus sp. OT TaxID=913865 RepID=UPI0002239B7D|nr:ABC transporter substrate binding protein [Desulfosporosinus sp. OT]EGW38736.1 his Kinase A domain protein [Desulfosporosinus sp. OT]